MIPLVLLAAWVALLFAGPIGWIIAGLWLGGGLYLVAASRSRGLYADAIFLLTWPVHWWLER